MVLAIPFFAADERGVAPECMAFMPFSQFRRRERGGYRCMPANFVSGDAIPQKPFERFFGLRGLAALEHDDWDKPLDELT
jgi:hypothetical protein